MSGVISKSSRGRVMDHKCDFCPFSVKDAKAAVHRLVLKSIPEVRLCSNGSPRRGCGLRFKEKPLVRKSPAFELSMGVAEPGLFPAIFSPIILVHLAYAPGPVRKLAAMPARFKENFPMVAAI